MPRPYLPQKYREENDRKGKNKVKRKKIRNNSNVKYNSGFQYIYDEGEWDSYKPKAQIQQH